MEMSWIDCSASDTVLHLVPAGQLWQVSKSLQSSQCKRRKEQRCFYVHASVTCGNIPDSGRNEAGSVVKELQSHRATGQDVGL